MRTRSGRPPLLRRGAVAAVLAAPLLGAVSSVPVGAPGAATDGIDYVALGDSYSAGPLIPRQRLEAGLCLRSDHDYPTLLADMLGVRSVRDVTCTGATADDLSRAVPNGFFGPPPPPQLAALDVDTDLVTVGIGGNDNGLFSALFRRCPLLAARDRTGSPCRRAFSAEGSDRLAAKVAVVGERVSSLLDEIHARAPAARVWVVGYLRVLPARGTCPAVPLAAGDYRWADRLERRLNAALAAAARSAGDGFVDTYAASRGHDACAGERAWVNGSVESLRRAAAYHPFRSGMAAVAALVRDLVREDRR